MHGDPVDEPAEIHCPIHHVTITPCDAAELTPLLNHLSANLPSQDGGQFPRGTLTDDGRLDLCKQSLGADNCQRIADALRHNTQVRSLMLGTDAIGDAGATMVAQLAHDNPRIEVLYLGCNNIGPAGARALGNMLEDSAQQVTGLWLKRNPLGPEGAASIARMLGKNDQLRVLDLVNTDPRDCGVRAVVDALCRENQRLHSLYLSGNGLGPSTAIHLARLLREAPHIKALYLSANRLGNAGAAVLADALRVNNTLQTLELASNGLGPEGAKAIFAAARYSSLQTLNLGYAPSTRVLGAQANHIGDDGAFHAAAFVTDSTTLRQLNIIRNGLTERGHLALLDAARRCLQLARLIVDRSLPDDLTEHLKRNQERFGDAVSSDQSLIRSVYR